MEENALMPGLTAASLDGGLVRRVRCVVLGVGAGCLWAASCNVRRTHAVSHHSVICYRHVYVHPYMQIDAAAQLSARLEEEAAQQRCEG